MATQIISKVVDISSTQIQDTVTQRDAYNPGLVLKDDARAVSVDRVGKPPPPTKHMSSCSTEIQSNLHFYLYK